MDATKRLQNAATRYTKARTERDEAIREAASTGLTRRAIATIVGLSHQRIQQIIRGK